VRPKAGLNFIGDEEHAVLVAKLDEEFEIVGGEQQIPPSQETGSAMDCRDLFLRDHSFKRCPRDAAHNTDRTKDTEVIGAAINNRRRECGKRRREVARKPSLVRMRFCCKSQRHHGAAVEGVLKGDDRRALCVRTGDLDGVFYRLSAAVDENSLLREVPGVTAFIRSASRM